jgi:hypothetical protein
VPVGTNGQIDIFNFAGNTDVIVDVVGFYASNDNVLPAFGLGGQFQPFNPFRLLDTRTDGGALPAQYMVDVPVDFGQFNSHIRAFAVNITAVGPTAAGGYLTAWNGVDSLPPTSTLNFTRGQTVPNMAIVPAAPCVIDPSCAGMPQIGVFNGSGGSVHVIVDIFGVYDDSTIDGGLRFHPMTPTRIVDSRIKQGITHALVTGQSATVVAPTNVRDYATLGLAMNVTAVSPTQYSYLTVWPGGASRPTVSNLNLAPGQTVPNAVMCGIGTNFDFNVFNNYGTVNVVVDVSGKFDIGITAVPAAQPSSRSTMTFKANSDTPRKLSGSAQPTYQKQL